MTLAVGLATALASRLRLRHCAEVGPGTLAHGRLYIRGGGRIRLGARVVLDGRCTPIELHVGPGAELLIDDDVHIEGGTSIEALQRVHIGARSHVGGFCKLLDNHFHQVTGNRRERPASLPVEVDADVRLGARSILLPGAHLGAGTLVHAGTVISRRFPPGVVLSGVPASVRRRSP
ncbi:acetyltransferase [Archangium sp.]|jgi:acetyltransferase-like isoleucine patch superfamily enzyme|uniref:acyltransferase n=1 Tax=Archangium sp. TaxID=1872627 RepID=UPI002ED925D6